MTATTAGENLSVRGCTVTVHRVTDASETQLFISARPSAEMPDSGAQARAVYGALLHVLNLEGADFRAVLRETIFFANVLDDLEAVRSARAALLASSGETRVPEALTATLEIEQPPLEQAHCLEVALQVSLSLQQGVEPTRFSITPGCECRECSAASAFLHTVGSEQRLHAAAIYGEGETAIEQTTAMFQSANALLAQAGMDFTDVVRTWIHLSEMDRDYPDFNRARREFFEAQGVHPSPASTGIGGGLASPAHTLSLGFYAVKGHAVKGHAKNADGVAAIPQRMVMTTPTLNEAPQYGADFSRGMRIEQGEGAALFVSGTASLDETGATVHVGDTAAQIDRMLLNLKTLLNEQGASFGNVVSAITYLKQASDAQLLYDKLEQAGFSGFPNNLVEARICRADLLCEIELLAMAHPH